MNRLSFTLLKIRYVHDDVLFKAQTYKADFEEERRDREVAAGKKEEEISLYKERIMKLESALSLAREEKRSAQKNFQQLKQDNTHNVSFDKA